MVKMTKPRNLRQDIWDYLRANRERFATMDEITDGSGVTYKTAHAYLRSLFRGGYVTVQQGFSFSRHHGYRLERDVGIEAPRLTADGSPAKSRATEAMWRTMKILKRFTLEELLAHVLMTHTTGRSNAMRYITALERAGYLKGIGITQKKEYVLIKNTGAKAPMVMRVEEVYDPNLDQIVLRDVPDYE